MKYSLVLKILSSDLNVGFFHYSRDKTGLNEALDEQKISTLLKLSNIYKEEEAIKKINEPNKNDLIVAALKALCNLVYNSPVAVTYVSRSHAAEGILMRLRMFKEGKISSMIKLFDIKLLFLITALSPEMRYLINSRLWFDLSHIRNFIFNNFYNRPKLKHELHGLIYLTESLDLILKESPPKSKDSQYVKLKVSNNRLSFSILKS